MKKFFIVFLFIFSTTNLHAFQVLSSKELGRGDARNQNVVVKCTSPNGETTNQTCTLRRYAKCNGKGNQQNCSGWQAWKDLRDSKSSFPDWRSAATSCCRAKGLR